MHIVMFSRFFNRQSYFFSSSSASGKLNSQMASSSSNQDDPILSIFFEKQKSALCAQHALNMLLQDPLYNPENLRELARQMDQLENEILGNNADAVGRSENMNDYGFFSIQVLEKALEVFDLRLTNIEKPEMREFKSNPLIGKAYICNLQEHWFVIRKFGAQWFELNSINSGPRLLSELYLSEFIHQIANEGYSTFVVQGILPRCDADDLISVCPVVPKVAPKKEEKEQNMVQKFFNTVGRRLGGSSEVPDNQEDRDLAIAMAMSMETATTVVDDEDLKKAIDMSMGKMPEDVKNQPSTSEASATSSAVETPILSTSSSSGVTPNAEQQRRDREKFLQRLEKKKSE